MALQDRRNRQSIIKPAQQCGETLVLFFFALILRHALRQIVATASSRRQSGAVLR